MANAIGNLFVTGLAAGSGIALSPSIPAIGSTPADGFIARTTATITYWSTGATPNASTGLWVTPADVWVFGGNLSKVLICSQGSAAIAFEFTLGGEED